MFVNAHPDPPTAAGRSGVPGRSPPLGTPEAEGTLQQVPIPTDKSW